MKSRIKDLEDKQIQNPMLRIRELHKLWLKGADVSGELEEIFEEHPDWKHQPPPRVGRNAWLNWHEFTNHKLKI